MVEFVASVVRSVPDATNGSFRPAVVQERVRYGPGSQWLFAKFYVPPQAADDLILRALSPTVAELREKHGLDCWFYVRYGDPQHHLRVRFHSTGGRVSEIRECILQRSEEWLRRGLVQRYAFDTYDPEYERYRGARSIEAIERFFCSNSDLCAALLAVTPDVTGERIAAAAKSFYSYVLGDDLKGCAVRAFHPAERRKLEAADRVSFKRLAAELREIAHSNALENAVTAPCSEALLASVFHLHCNRLALSADGEARAMLLLRALLLSRNAA